MSDTSSYCAIVRAWWHLEDDEVFGLDTQALPVSGRAVLVSNGDLHVRTSLDTFLPRKELQMACWLMTNVFLHK